MGRRTRRRERCARSGLKMAWVPSPAAPGGRGAVTRRWPATGSGRSGIASGRPLPGDPMAVATTATAIDASPVDVWPWLVQVEYGRAGWYGYDWLVNRGAQGERILAYYQRLDPGDGLRNCGTDDASPQGYDVRTVFPSRALVIVRARNLRSGVNATHDLGWRPDSYVSVGRAPAARGRASRRCRLIVRTRLESAPAWLRSLVRLVVPAEPLMQRRRLVEIRPCAESRAAAEADGSARAAGRGARARRFLLGGPRPASGWGR
jgi:hypothetical protein